MELDGSIEAENRWDKLLVLVFRVGSACNFVLLHCEDLNGDKGRFLTCEWCSGVTKVLLRQGGIACNLYNRISAAMKMTIVLP